MRLRNTTDISRRILLANITYFSVLHFIKYRTTHRKNKIRIYNTIRRPILYYGCEAWTMTSKSEEMLDAFVKKILRRIYGPKKGGRRMEDEVQHQDI
jgi:hypothetical protein